MGYLLVIACLCPLGAFVVEVLVGKHLRRAAAYLATGAMVAATGLALAALVDFVSRGGRPEAASFTWLRVGRQALAMGYYVDGLTAAMGLMVTFVATLIHIYSIGYMHGDPRFPRFFTYLSLFSFSMLGLVLADNLLLVFVFWELVGLCSYLLIGFWYEKDSAANAGKKAFIVNRVGDAGMLVGLGLLWTVFGTFRFHGDGGLFAQVAQEPPAMGLLLAIGVCVFAGAVGKSAQFPLHVWLPDAMEGPTPVSALIHAATMVAAGVYLVGRFFPVYEACFAARMVVAYTGAITLFLAATIALVMTDIKRVLAYSTISQLGYMMLGLGVGGWAAGLFHLLTHAFFKALLFLCAGSVIHGCHHEQNMLKMGGLYRKMPITAITMLVGTLAISGVIFFSGYYSKDAVLYAALAFGLEHRAHFLLFVLPTLGAALTAFYMFRLWFLTFAGLPRDRHVYHHARESPAVMWVPLVVLAVPAVGIGWGGYIEPLLEMGRVQAGPELPHSHTLHTLVGLIAGAMAGLGILLAAVVYLWRRLDPEAVADQYPRLYRFLWNKWYFDELYDRLFVRPTLRLAQWCRAMDLKVIDGLIDGSARTVARAAFGTGRFDLRVIDGIVNLVAQATYAVGRGLRRVQAGRVRTYVLIVIVASVGLFAAAAYLITW